MSFSRLKVFRETCPGRLLAGSAIIRLRGCLAVFSIQCLFSFHYRSTRRKGGRAWGRDSRKRTRGTDTPQTRRRAGTVVCQARAAARMFAQVLPRDYRLSAMVYISASRLFIPVWLSWTQRCTSMPTDDTAEVALAEVAGGTIKHIVQARLSEANRPAVSSSSCLPAITPLQVSARQVSIHRQCQSFERLGCGERGRPKIN